MKREKIRELIDRNNKKIEEILNVTSFVLNREVYRLMQENESFADQCMDHEDDGTGICKYCLMTIKGE